MSAGEFNAPNAPLVTPNVLKTPLVAARTGKVTASTPLRTPDALAINEPKRRKQEEEMIEETPDLFASLATLPAPKNQYRVVVPTLAPEEETRAITEPEVVDAADIRDKLERKRAEQLEMIEQLQSQVLLRGLPRASKPENASKLNSRFAADVEKLITYDNAITPLAVPGKKNKRARPTAPEEAPEMDPMSEKDRTFFCFSVSFIL
jgi:hypothetical protein